MNLLSWAALAVAAVLLVLAALHVFWAFGGKTTTVAAIPEAEGRPLFTPSRASTLAVAVGLAAAALVALVQGGTVAVPFGQALLFRLGAGFLALLFAARAIGERRYLGFFKRVKGTGFATWDTWLFSPLCLLLALGFLALCV